MYELFDGTISQKEIANKVGVSSEGVRQLVILLEQAGIVEQVAVNGKQKNPKRVFRSCYE